MQELTGASPYVLLVVTRTAPLNIKLKPEACPPDTLDRNSDCYRSDNRVCLSYEYTDGTSSRTRSGLLTSPRFHFREQVPTFHRVPGCGCANVDLPNQTFAFAAFTSHTAIMHRQNSTMQLTAVRSILYMELPATCRVGRLAETLLLHSKMLRL